ncbi:MAG: glycosyltransferase family 4 protein [Fusobacteriaceae bacterium]
MKILIIGPFPNPITGQSISNETLCNGLSEKGYVIESIDTNFSKTLTDKVQQGKFDLKKIFITISRSINECKKILFEKNEVVYMTPGATFLGIMRFSHYMLFSIIMKKKYFLHIHNGVFKKMYDSLSPIKKKTVLFFFKRSAGIIVLGDSLRAMFEELIPQEKIFVCENGVQDEFVATEEEIKVKLEKYAKDTKKRVLYLSNLMEEKGILDLLKASEKFKSEEIELNLAGAIEPSLEKIIKEYLEKYPEKVKYHGIVKGKEKKRLLLENYIFILPTYYSNEGQPISILEAYTNGCAVITDKCTGGIIDIFNHDKNGLNCQNRNIENIYLSIKNIDEIKYIEMNYNYGKKKFLKNSFIDRIEKIII